MDIEALVVTDEKAYEEMLHKAEDTLLYVSLKYRDLLRQCVDAEDYYLIAKRGNDILGAFPLFLKRNSTHGNILNSLPFYGSNGGIIISPNVKNVESVFEALVAALHSFACEMRAVAVTIITSPFEGHIQLYEKYLNCSFRDRRIGQVAFLPPCATDNEDAVMRMIHSKTRNMVRKARKSGIAFSHSSDLQNLRFLADTHQDNMKAMGGFAKGWEFFKTVSEGLSMEQTIAYMWPH